MDFKNFNWEAEKPPSNKDLEILNCILARPGMYVGDGPDASNSLAWFINGWLAAVGGLSMDGYLMRIYLQADANKTLQENAMLYQEKLKSYGLL